MKHVISVLTVHTTQVDAQRAYDRFTKDATLKVIEGWKRYSDVTAVQDDDVVIYTQAFYKSVGESPVSA